MLGLGCLGNATHSTSATKAARYGGGGMGQCTLDLRNFGLSIPESARDDADVHLAGFKVRYCST